MWALATFGFEEKAQDRDLNMCSTLHTVSLTFVTKYNYNDMDISCTTELTLEIEYRWHVADPRVDILAIICSFCARDFEFVLHWRHMINGSTRDFKHLEQHRLQHSLRRVLYSLALNYRSIVVANGSWRVVYNHSQNPLLPSATKITKKSNESTIKSIRFNIICSTRTPPALRARPSRTVAALLDVQRN